MDCVSRKNVTDKWNYCDALCKKKTCIVRENYTFVGELLHQNIKLENKAAIVVHYLNRDHFPNTLTEITTF